MQSDPLPHSDLLANPDEFQPKKSNRVCWSVDRKRFVEEINLARLVCCKGAWPCLMLFALLREEDKSTKVLTIAVTSNYD